MIQINGEKAMKEFGQKVGRLARGGDMFELVGDVGAGKTTFIKGFATGLSIDEAIQSPSFTISRTYDARDGLEFSHYDFYRLQDPGILTAELQEIAGRKDAVVAIEWADIVTGVLPTDRLTIRITPDGDDSRQLLLIPGGGRSEALVEMLR